MTPRDFRVMAEAKIGELQKQQKALDQMFAAQTARLMFMQGRTAKDPIDPATCMTFVWDQKARETHTEMTEEDMTRFDNNMDVWGGVRPRG